MKGKKIRIQPLGDRLLVQEIAHEDKAKKTASGIFIPDSVGEDKGSKQGTVIAVGNGKYVDGRLIALEAKVGDKILFQWGDKITLDGIEYYVVSENSVLAVIK